ncbi:hypothetical protein ISF_00906 [Cordyceps fumosorosea ARSEF 2679]|uniref:DUF1445 domain protein n=1 Tax=Cordyceps fumosorosea (strain ARSEF 2679) TaxID=1081104 RepID=A0A168EMY5_CORFA|nr:hypothetical protein ISF_00906 [Cordyceps fumosorosea ARSEF 2679]OAA74005.1 hypothetical protein ISF_00906 [Cordyceps fumosorosea ARSEF 2679]
MVERDYATATGLDVRLAAREGKHTGPTAGLAPGFLQANLLVLPAEYADDFRRLCARNPVPCPLIGESSGPGIFDSVTGSAPRLSMATGCDLRTDIPAYMVYEDGRLVKSHSRDVQAEWTARHVGFLIGCSYSFETALAAVGLRPRHVAQGRNVPMYRTTLALMPAGKFTGATCVVSMRAYRRREVDEVRRVTARFGATHGEPLAWGWEAVGRLGIRDVDEPEWGDAPLTEDGMPLGKRRREGEGDGEEEEEEVPVFWGCGVTPQEAVMRAGLKGVVMAHAPGHMLVLDAKDEDIVG